MEESKEIMRKCRKLIQDEMDSLKTEELEPFANGIAFGLKLALFLTRGLQPIGKLTRKFLIKGES
tara:strand:- start:210 stop:404 length:195 start_codon:yes stop_codon:yes gene_type:complete